MVDQLHAVPGLFLLNYGSSNGLNRDLIGLKRLKSKGIRSPIHVAL